MEKKHTVRNVEKKVTKLARQLKPEIKYITDDYALPIGAGTAYVDGPDIGRGTLPSQRTGARVRLLGAELNYYIFNTAGQAPAFLTAPRVVRVCVILDKMGNEAAVLNLAKVFDEDSNVPGNFLFPTTQRNREYLSRFSILYDKVHVVGPELQQGGANTTSLGDNNSNYIIRRNIKLNFKTPGIYNETAATGTPANTIAGHLYIAYFGTIVPAGVPATVMNATMRLKFTDV